MEIGVADYTRRWVQLRLGMKNAGTRIKYIERGEANSPAQLENMDERAPAAEVRTGAYGVIP